MDAVETKQMNVNAVLLAEQISIGYGEKVILKDVTFSLPAGCIFSVVGANGMGKSTLLRGLSGLLPLSGGWLSLMGEDAATLSGEKRARLLSIVTTSQPLGDWVSVYEAVAFGRYPYTGRLGTLSKEDRTAIDEAIRMLDLAPLTERYLNALSDGQRQRVWLARCLAQQTPIVLLDEPFHFLDYRYRKELADLIRRLAREKGLSFLFSVHDLPLAAELSDMALCLKDGRAFLAEPGRLLEEAFLEDLYCIKDAFVR